jgi:DNA-binding response OmpR family regulator
MSEARMIPTSKSKLILVVEDDPLIRSFESAALKHAGFEVITACDGIEGGTLFARQFEEIDLLVTDISLPGMSGLELAAFARKIRADLKIVFASGSIDAECREVALLLANSKFLAKPFTVGELMECIADLMAPPAASVAEAAAVGPVSLPI